MVVHHGRLSNWFRVWKDLAGDIEGRLLGLSILNIIPVLYFNLKRHRQGNPWTDRLEKFLNDAINADDPTIQLIREEHEPEVLELKHILHTREGQVRNDKKMSTEQLCAVLDRIKDAPLMAPLKEELKTELLRQHGADESRLSLISHLILQKALTRHDSRAIAELPEGFFTRSATALLVGEHIKALAENKSLEKELWEKWQTLLRNSFTKDMMMGYINREAVFLQDLFKEKSGSWTNATFDLIDDLAEHWAKLLKTKTIGNEPTTPVAVVQACQQMTLELGRWLIRQYVRVFLHQIFDTFAKSQTDEEDSPLNDVGSLIAVYLREKAGFVDKSGWRFGQNPRYVASLVVEALGDATAKRLAAAFSEAVMPDDLEQLSVTAGKILVGSFIADSDAVSRDWSAISSDDIDQLCVDWMARKPLQRRLGSLLIPLNEKIAGNLERLLRSVPLESLTGWPKDMLLFWKEWAEAFSIRAITFGSLFEYVPWEQLTAEQFGSVLDEFFNSLFPPERRFQGIFKVKGIKPDGAIWSTGDVTFYDPDLLDYGEGSCFLFYERWPEGDDLIYAKVVVTADTFAKAHEAALQSLNDALNALSFAASVGSPVGGLKPDIIYESYMVRLSQKRRSFKAERSPTESYRAQPAAGLELPKLSRAFDHLLTLSNKYPDQLTQLQRGFLRAIHWYRKGRWSKDSVERFLFYWIAIEHLFMGGDSRSGSIFDGMPEFHITWQDWKAFYWVPLSLRAIIKNIEANEELRYKIKADPQLSRWERDPKVLLQPENLELLASLTPDTLPDTQKYFLKCAEDFREIAKKRARYDQVLEALRDDFHIKLRFLYRLRNELVHEALPDRAGIKVYTEALEGVLEDVLRKMANAAIQETPDYQTVEELTGWYEIPWS